MSARTASRDLVEVRRVVREALEACGHGSAVIVACSGGPDSLALAGAAAWAAPRVGVRVVAVIIDHGLQDGSAATAQQAAHACAALGIVDVEVVPVEVGRSGGPEAAARDARYAALHQAAREHGAAAVLLGHTLDDQAETVLLRLARGSGARSLAAMAPRSGLLVRPFLGTRRSQVHAAAGEMLDPLGLRPWHDPHNLDSSFARSRIREAMAALTEQLGDGFVLGLTRSAMLARADADALDAIAEVAYAAGVVRAEGEVSCEVGWLAGLADAVRWRVLRAMALALDAPAEDVDNDHVMRLDAFVTQWHGQGPARLPAGIIASRDYGRLVLRRGLPDSERV